MPTAYSACAMPLGYLGDKVTWVKFQYLANSLNSSLMKHVALSLTRVMGIPVSQKMVLKVVITEVAASEGKRHSNIANEK